MKIKSLKPLVVLTAFFCAFSLRAGTITYIYTDTQGTLLAEADGDGVVRKTFDYRPYGSLALGSGSNGPAYTGHVSDLDSGLTYMQARYYDASIGRFISIDQKEVSAGDWMSFSRFMYANGNPVGNIDPDGRQTVPVRTDIPHDQLTESDRAAIAAGNRSQLLYEKAVFNSRNVTSDIVRYSEEYATTQVVYQRELSADAKAIVDKSGQNTNGLKAYREPGKNVITLLPGYKEFSSKNLKFPSYFGMPLGKGGDATLYKVISHEHGHVLDEQKTAHNLEKTANQHAEEMQKIAPSQVKRDQEK